MEGIEDSTSMETTEISEVQDNSNMYTSGAQGSTAEEGTSQEPAPQPSHSEPWPEHFTTALAFFLSNEAIEQVMQLYLEGPDPPRVSDSGWGGRVARATVQEDTNNINPEPTLEEPEKTKDGKRGRDRAGRNSRGERGSRGGRGGRAGGDRDHRKVLSDVCVSPCLYRLRPTTNSNISIAHHIEDHAYCFAPSCSSTVWWKIGHRNRDFHHFF